MKRDTYRRLLLAAQLLAVAGLGLAALWNVSSLLHVGLPDPNWLAIGLAAPGLLLWAGAIAAPRVAARGAPPAGETYRLVYDAPEGWSAGTARQALLALAHSSGDLRVTWARDGVQEGEMPATGCWIRVPEGWGEVLGRMVGDVFPGGQIERDEPPAPGEGVVILAWRGETPPPPPELCRMPGVEGVFFRWRDAGTATLAVWGDGAPKVAHQFARDSLVGQGAALNRPFFGGDNPWPELFDFPPSRTNPGLASVSGLARMEPALRVSGRALVVGRDDQDRPSGFPLPELGAVKPLWVAGTSAEWVVVSLACQAIQAGYPTLFFDGRGSAVSVLTQRLMREVATGRVLWCDVERPAQSRLRLNPLWLPAAPETWPAVLAAWSDWLREELGVTPGGLGQAAYRHSRVAVVLSALLAAGQGAAIDPPGLRSALDGVDFLPLAQVEALPLRQAQGRSLRQAQGRLCHPADVLGERTWAWWESEGRHAPNFDVQLRLGHLRDRLDGLLTLPEYRVLWQAPYLDPLAALNQGVEGLLWRIPNAHRRLRAYATSQFLALATLLAAWPTQADKPVLIFFHELEVGAWAARIAAFPAARPVFARRSAAGLPSGLAPQALVVSRLEKEDAVDLQHEFFPSVRVADLRRLADGRALFWRGGAYGTLDLSE